MALLYLAAFILLVLFQRRILYHPSRPPGGREIALAKDVGLAAWEVDGQFMGWRTTNQNPQASLLMFHGNAGQAVYLSSFLSGLREATGGKVQAYLMEYPGYGGRPGSPSEASLIAAAQQALSALPGDQPVYLLGQSLGCAVAAGLMADAPTNRIQGAILVVPFNNLPATASHHFPIFPMSLALKDTYRSDQRLARDLGPIHFALAEEDRVIPVALGKKLHDGYPGRKKLTVKPGAGHNDLNNPDARWWREAFEFLAPKLGQ